MSETLEIEGLAELERRLGRVGDRRGIVRVATNALRRNARRIVSATIKEQKTRGVLRTVFRRDAAGLRKLVHAGRVTDVGGHLEVKISVKGLAWIQEVGGHIAPHRVNHPGAQHPAFPVFAAAFRSGQQATIADFARAFEGYIAKAWARG